MKIITVPADLSYLHEVLTQVDEYLESQGCSQEFISETELIIEELFTNTVHYAYANSDHEPVCVFTLDEENGILKIRRIDYGTPFDPTQTEKPDTTLSYKERKIGGLGMHLIRHYTDALTYRRKEGKNILTLYRALKNSRLPSGH